ncbi:MAG: hypothetical protein ABJH72_03285 [Reichenbachiella sp.]|uniref:hypothetical protein n=1 Tax=Reichenbachiella sp. TaxID=2184521 RepID=UPI0032632BAF
MFDGSDYPKPLDEELFDSWLEKGRQSKISYSYLLIIWDEFESAYEAAYTEDREAIRAYEWFGESSTHESLVAIYDLYSESRISLMN